MWLSDVISQILISNKHNKKVITWSWLEVIWGKKHEAGTAEKVILALTRRDFQGENYLTCISMNSDKAVHFFVPMFVNK